MKVRFQSWMLGFAGAGLLVPLAFGHTQAFVSPQQPEAKTKSDCKAIRTEDPSIPETTFAFSGHVSGGETYECPLSQEFTFRLLPTADGWQIAVLQEPSGGNIARMSVMRPTTVFVNASDICQWHQAKSAMVRDFGLSLDSEVANSSSNDGTGEKASGAPLMRSGAGAVEVTNVKTVCQPAISEMTFNVVMHVVTIVPIDGLTVYQVDKTSHDITPPKLVYSPAPSYSEKARKARYQGTVVLWLVVGVDGRAKKVAVMRSIGQGLDEKAVEAVTTWRFDPATRVGKPVPVVINVEVNFKLH